MSLGTEQQQVRPRRAFADAPPSRDVVACYAGVRAAAEATTEVLDRDLKGLKGSPPRVRLGGNWPRGAWWSCRIRARPAPRIWRSGSPASAVGSLPMSLGCVAGDETAPTPAAGRTADRRLQRERVNGGQANVDK